MLIDAVEDGFHALAAMGGRGLRIYLDRLYEMTRCEWLLREQSSVFGFLWTLLQPLLMFVVLFGLFTKWMGSKTPNYGAFLLIGIMHYQFFQNTTNYALSALTRRAALITSFSIPRDLVVLSAALSGLISHLVEAAIVVAFLLALGVAPRLSWMFFPLVLVLEAVLVIGVFAPLLAVWGAKYPDFERLWSIVTFAGMFMTPVFYPLSVIEPAKRAILLFNPLTVVVEMSRACLIGGALPPSLKFLGIAAFFSTAAAASYLFFKSREKYLGDYVLE